MDFFNIYFCFVAYLISLMDLRYFCPIITQFAKCLWGKGLNGATCIMATPCPKHGNQYPNFVSLYEGQDALLHYTSSVYATRVHVHRAFEAIHNGGWPPWGNRVCNHGPRPSILPNGPPQKREYIDTWNIIRESAPVAVKATFDGWFEIIRKCNLYARLSWQ